MIRQTVSSSNIRSIGYVSKSQTLEIEFHSGGIYQYFNVPESIYNALIATSSHGSYFHRHIKVQYQWTKYDRVIKNDNQINPCSKLPLYP